MNTRIGPRLSRPPRPSDGTQVWPQALVGVLLVTVALGLADARYELPVVGMWVVPLVAYITGTALVWSPLDSAAARDPLRPEFLGLVFSKQNWGRVAAGLAMATASMVWFADWRFTDVAFLRFLVMVPTIVLGVALLIAPWWLHVARQAGVERRQRIREYERAEIAAHLHDSVLQTLTLIRRNAEDSAMVAKLARAQERDLRAYLYQDRKDPSESVATALAAALSEVEDAHGVEIEAVAVGDAPTDADLRAVVRAAREAASNAARHGRPPYSVYAEVAGGTYDVFIRDGGPGFDPDAVPEDRMGIRESIMGRVRRHGGSASVDSRPGGRTEVRLSMPLARATEEDS